MKITLLISIIATVTLFGCATLNVSNEYTPGYSPAGEDPLTRINRLLFVPPEVQDDLPDVVEFFRDGSGLVSEYGASDPAKRRALSYYMFAMYDQMFFDQLSLWSEPGKGAVANREVEELALRFGATTYVIEDPTVEQWLGNSYQLTFSRNLTRQELVEIADYILQGSKSIIYVGPATYALANNGRSGVKPLSLQSDS